MPKNMKYDQVSAKAGSGKKKGASDYKKGAAETVKQEKKDLKKDMEGGMKNAGDVPGKKGVAKHHGNMPNKKGAGDYDVKKGSHDHPHSGPGRMGYTQNFGPARQNGYAKGAAKVAKIMGYPGAADAGHGEPVGHDHPTKTITSREVSGGGSNSSSSSVSNSNIPKATGGEQTKDISGYMTALNKRFPNTSGADLASKKYISSDMISNYDSKFKSNSTSSSNPRTVSESSETTVSPMSMSETLRAGEIQDTNRAQTNRFNKEITNITASNDSISKVNSYLNSLPPYQQNEPRKLKWAKVSGGRAAYDTRIKSGDYSRAEAMKMYKEGQNKNNNRNL